MPYPLAAAIVFKKKKSNMLGNLPDKSLPQWTY